MALTMSKGCSKQIFEIILIIKTTHDTGTIISFL